MSIKIQLKSYSNIPSGFTGIAEHADGSKEWYKEGKLHREDGPACEYAERTKKWYIEGKLHREDGPAVEWADGTKSWWMEGKRHREDGPAIERSDGIKEWYLEGTRFSSEEEWKAELEKRSLKTIQVKNPHDIPSGFTGIAEYADGTKAWYLEGKLHREDGPAIERSDGTKVWYLEGKRHREDGPAIERSDETKEWYKEGFLHREDGPACEYSNGTKSWWREGLRHREDGPAIEYADGTKEWFKEGKRHREDGPATEWIDGSKFWFIEGKRHREDGPAIEWLDGTKAWFKEGKLHREDGPACEYADGSKSWWRNGKLHREDGPACEYPDGSKSWYLDGIELSSEAAWKAELEKRNMKTIQVKISSEIPSGFTGIVEWPNGTKVWYKEGKYHREDGPAIESASGVKEWFKEGLRHREDGPASEYADGSKYWYKEGKCHREDGPATEYVDGTKVWYKEGKYHREDGPAIESASGTKFWYKEGKYHREDGPACEYSDGTKVWFIEGKRHREDGPAYEYADGTKFWFLDGIELSSEAAWKAELEKRNMKTIQVKISSEIPSGFTGIVEWPNGTKVWYKEGKRHREDGPATEWIDGSKFWFIEGKRHREDGPAIEWLDGTKAWYKEGKCHREDGPAIEHSDGTKTWYLEGTRFSSEEEWKAELEKRSLKTIQVKDSSEIPSGFTGIVEWPNGTKVWYKEGKYHREDGPAIESASGVKEWFKEGLRHREDGPASEYADGSKYWYKEGKVHREDGPAVEYWNGSKEWFIEGKLHREDGPAVEWANGAKAWYVEGKYHREDGPACEYSDGTKVWYKEGKRHREDGPAYEGVDGTKLWFLDETKFSSEEEWKAELEKRNLKTIRVKQDSEIPSGFTGIIEYPDGTKVWYKEGKGHREDGPAIERSDGTKTWYLDGTSFSSEKEWKTELEKRSLKTIQVKNSSEIPSGFTGIAEYTDRTKVWYKEGLRHREDGPAYENTAGTKEWYKEGKLHREDGPACEYASGSKEWLKEGKLHREDGPAIEYPDGSKSWYLNGTRFSSEGEWKAELEKRNMKTIQVKNFSDIPSGFTGIVEYSNGTKAWFKEGKLHREDGPACEYADGSKSWWREGLRHREDGPAIEFANGTKFWYLNGAKFSSEEEWKAELEKRNMKTIQVKNPHDIPSGFTGIVEYPDGTKSWFKEGRLHREDGPACEYPNGAKKWFIEGKLHREDGPACEYPDGSKEWFKEGRLHREDGPAIEWPDGTKLWFLDETKFSSEGEWKMELEKQQAKNRVKFYDFYSQLLNMLAKKSSYFTFEQIYGIKDSNVYFGKNFERLVEEQKTGSFFVPGGYVCLNKGQIAGTGNLLNEISQINSDGIHYSSHGSAAGSNFYGPITENYKKQIWKLGTKTFTNAKEFFDYRNSTNNVNACMVYLSEPDQENTIANAVQNGITRFEFVHSGFVVAILSLDPTTQKFEFQEISELATSCVKELSVLAAHASDVFDTKKNKDEVKNEELINQTSSQKDVDITAIIADDMIHQTIPVTTIPVAGMLTGLIHQETKEERQEIMAEKNGLLDTLKGDTKKATLRTTVKKTSQAVRETIANQFAEKAGGSKKKKAANREAAAEFLRSDLGEFLLGMTFGTGGMFMRDKVPESMRPMFDSVCEELRVSAIATGQEHVVEVVQPVISVLSSTVTEGLSNLLSEEEEENQVPAEKIRASALPESSAGHTELEKVSGSHRSNRHG